MKFGEWLEEKEVLAKKTKNGTFKIVGSKNEFKAQFISSKGANDIYTMKTFKNIDDAKKFFNDNKDKDVDKLASSMVKRNY